MTIFKNDFWVECLPDKKTRPSDSTYNKSHGNQNTQFEVLPLTDSYCKEHLRVYDKIQHGDRDYGHTTSNH